MYSVLQLNYRVKNKKTRKGGTLGVFPRAKDAYDAKNSKIKRKNATRQLQ